MVFLVSKSVSVNEEKLTQKAGFEPVTSGLSCDALPTELCCHCPRSLFLSANQVFINCKSGFSETFYGNGIIVVLDLID